MRFCIRRRVLSIHPRPGHHTNCKHCPVLRCAARWLRHGDCMLHQRARFRVHASERDIPHGRSDTVRLCVPERAISARRVQPTLFSPAPPTPPKCSSELTHTLVDSPAGGRHAPATAAPAAPSGRISRRRRRNAALERPHASRCRRAVDHPRSGVRTRRITLHTRRSPPRRRPPSQRGGGIVRGRRSI